MTEIALSLDRKAQESIRDLMDHYHVKTKAEIISKAIAILTIAAHIERTQGELVARKGMQETKIVVS